MPLLAQVAEWHTQQVEGLCPFGRGGSTPLLGMKAETIIVSAFLLPAEKRDFIVHRLQLWI